MKASEKVFHKYRYLARKYAQRIYAFEELSFEREDLVQEFEMKIYTAIKAWGRRWLFYRREGYNKPVPIKYYIECALSNKAKDFTALITRENYKTRIDDINYDYGVEDDYRVNPERNSFVINGVDLLEGLTGRERICFSFFLRGYKTSEINKVYLSGSKGKGQTRIPVTQWLENRKDYLLEKYGEELRKVRTIYETYQINDNY